MAEVTKRQRRIIVVVFATVAVAGVVAVSVFFDRVNTYAPVGCLLLYLAILTILQFILERKGKL